MMKQLYDITEVCSMLGTTSRTLRYYEDQGLIASTVIPPSARRRYTQEQIDTVKHVLALRTLGLSVKTIKELSRKQTSLRDAILLHRAELIRFMAEKQKQINLLGEVLHDIDTSKTDPVKIKHTIECTDEQIKIAEICTEAIINGDYTVLYPYFSDDMRIVLPEDVFAHSIKMTTAPIGKYISKGTLFRDKNNPNVMIYPLKYEKMMYRLKYVFHGETICGIWTDYE